jgi:hypothetical protein
MVGLKKKFRLYWKDGKTEEVEGFDIASAFYLAGHTTSGEIGMLDYYKELGACEPTTKNLCDYCNEIYSKKEERCPRCFGRD